MRVLFVSPEAYPLAKTGGLADVSTALPRALAEFGVDVRVLMPAYSCALEQLSRPHVIANFNGLMGVESVRILAARIPGADVPIWLVDAPELYARRGLYQDNTGNDWTDNARRFAFLCHVAVRISMGRTDIAWKPDVVHANEWHTGLVPLLLSQEAAPHPATIFTIHNMAFQGNFPPAVLRDIDISEENFSPGSIEYYGQISFLKGGIRFANKLTTVSSTYAREILMPEYGFGFEGLLRERSGDLTGILNGIDYSVWDPAHDPFLESHYDATHLNGKKLSKSLLQREMGLPEVPDTPVFAFVSRLTEQKMADVLLALLPKLADSDMQFVILSDGTHDLEQAFQDTADAHPTKIAVRIGYTERLAHRIHAGADILLAPARFEPCGLSQIYAMRYGTIPIVRATGGLADTVVDTTRTSITEARATGFVFTEPTPSALEEAILQANIFYQEPLAWRRLQLNAMKQEFGWAESARQYLSLYEEVTQKVPDEHPPRLLVPTCPTNTLEQAAS